jgi:coenzyme PQQ precursor peptide PqqA
VTWTKPDFDELSLCMEVTAYVNAEDELPLPVAGDQRHSLSQATVDEQPDQ